MSGIPSIMDDARRKRTAEKVERLRSPNDRPNAASGRSIDSDGPMT